MKLRYYILFHIILTTSIVLAQGNNIEALMNENDYISASLVVVSSGNKIYSAGGHVALRMNCPTQDVDYIYEFDASAGSEESLFFQYLNERLNGKYVRCYASDFYDKVRAEGRQSVDYTLNLTPHQEVKLWSLIDDEVDSDKEYPFSPDRGNCCSMILSVLEKSVDTGTLSNPKATLLSKTTGRDYIDAVFKTSPWAGLLWNVITGTGLDKHTSPIHLINPELIGVSLSKIINPRNGEPLINANTNVKETFNIKDRSVIRPEGVFFTIFIICLSLSIFNMRGWFLKISMCLDIVLLVATTSLGIILWYMLLASIFQGNIRYNMLVAIFNPFPLILLFIGREMWRLYSMAMVIISTVYLLGINFIPQIQVYGLWVFVAAILLRSLCFYTTTRPDKKQKFNIIKLIT